MLDDTIDARGRGELPDDQFVDVRYADLMRDPVATIARVYERLGIDVPPALDAADHRPPRRAAEGRPRRRTATRWPTPASIRHGERARFRRYQAHYDVPDE